MGALTNLFCGKRLPFSDTTSLLIALFVLGNPTDSYCQSLNNIVDFMMDEMDIKFIGVSELPWQEEKLKEALKKSVCDTVKMGDFAYFLSSPGPNTNPSILMKKVRLAYNQTKQRVAGAMNKGVLSEKLSNILQPLLDLESRLEIDTRVMLLPPYPRNYLIALAIKNLAPSPGTPVPMDRIWRFITHYFPYYEEMLCWCLDDLKNSVDFMGTSKFEFGGLETNFTVKLSLEETTKIMEEICQFNVQHKQQIEKCLCSDQTENPLYDMESGMLPVGNF